MSIQWHIWTKRVKQTSPSPLPQAPLPLQPTEATSLWLPWVANTPLSLAMKLNLWISPNSYFILILTCLKTLPLYSMAAQNSIYHSYLQTQVTSHYSKPYVLLLEQGLPVPSSVLCTWYPFSTSATEVGILLFAAKIYYHLAIYGLSFLTTLWLMNCQSFCCAKTLRVHSTNFKRKPEAGQWFT